MTKKQANEREQLIFGRPYNPDTYIHYGGVQHFDRISVNLAKELVRKGYLDPADTQNNSPTAQEMIDFCDDGTDIWYLHGYAVSAERPDCRVTIEGIGSAPEPITKDKLADFVAMFRDADELWCEGNLWCWYD